MKKAFENREYTIVDYRNYVTNANVTTILATGAFLFVACRMHTTRLLLHTPYAATAEAEADPNEKSSRRWPCQSSVALPTSASCVGASI